MVHIVGAIQTDLGNGSTPRFEQADPRTVSGRPRVQKNHGGVLGGGDHRINRETEGSSVRNGAAGRGYLNRKNPDSGGRRNGKCDRLELAVSKHEWSCWLRGHARRESGKRERDRTGEAVQCGNGDGYRGTRGSQSCGNLSCR